MTEEGIELSDLLDISEVHSEEVIFSNLRNGFINFVGDLEDPSSISIFETLESLPYIYADPDAIGIIAECMYGMPDYELLGLNRKKSSSKPDIVSFARLVSLMVPTTDEAIEIYMAIKDEIELDKEIAPLFGKRTLEDGSLAWECSFDNAQNIANNIIEYIMEYDETLAKRYINEEYAAVMRKWEKQFREHVKQEFIRKTGTTEQKDPNQRVRYSLRNLLNFYLNQHEQHPDIPSKRRDFLLENLFKSESGLQPYLNGDPDDPWLFSKDILRVYKAVKDMGLHKNKTLWYDPPSELSTMNSYIKAFEENAARAKQFHNFEYFCEFLRGTGVFPLDGQEEAVTNKVGADYLAKKYQVSLEEVRRRIGEVGVILSDDNGIQLDNDATEWPLARVNERGKELTDFFGSI